MKKLIESFMSRFMWSKNSLGIKEVTTTLTDSCSGELKGPLPTDLELVIEKMRDRQGVTLHEISLVMSDLFDQKAVTHTTNKFQETIIKDCIFVIEEVRLVSQSYETRPTDLLFKMKDIVYNMEMEIKVPAAHFHEVFRPIDLTHLEKGRNNNDD